MNDQQKDKQRLRALVDHFKLRMRGHWCPMIAHEAPDFYEVVEIPGRPIACPMHGEEDVYFTLDRDGNDTGAGYCPKCGHVRDGIALLMLANNISFSEALDTISVWLHDFELALRTGRPCTLTAERYMRLPASPHLRYRRKLNRFSGLMPQLPVQPQPTAVPMKKLIPPTEPADSKLPEPKRMTLAEKLRQQRS